MALTAERDTKRRGDAPILDLLFLGLKDAVKIWQGGLTVLDPSTGYVQPGAAGQVGMVAVGKAEATVDNTGVGHAAGAVGVHVRQGNHYWASAGGGDTITAANIGASCYVVDDQTVGLTDNSGTRALAGIIIDFSSVLGVLVETAVDLLPTKIRAQDIKPVAAGDVTGGVAVFRKAWAAPGAGAQDLQLFAAAAVPFKCRVLDVQIRVSNAGAAAADTATLRSAVAGGGNALSSAMPTGALGKATDDGNSTGVLATTDGLFLRLTDGTGSGEVIVTVRPET